MILECTLVRAPTSAVMSGPEELTIDVVDGTPGARLQSAIKEYCPSVGDLSVGGLPLSQLTAGTAPLANGAVLVDGGLSPSPRSGVPRASHLLLLVHSGPGAGSVYPLERGKYVIGRSDADICIPDPEMSRAHALLEVTETAVTITDRHSANGTFVDDRRIPYGEVTTSSTIRCGRSRMAIGFEQTISGRAELSGAGQSVARQKVAGIPEGANRTQLLLTAGLPLLLGIGMVLATGMWMFLAFTAVSAAALLVPALSGRRARREFRSALESAAAQDEERRRRTSPSAALLFLAGPRSSPPETAEPSPPDDVWLRLGTCRQKAGISVEPPCRNAPIPERLTPLVLDPSSRITVIRGQKQRVDGLVRFLIMQLAAYPRSAFGRIIVCGSPDSLPLPARFLPQLHMVSTTAAALDCLQEASGHQGWLFLLDSEANNQAHSEAIQAASSSSWRIFITGTQAGQAAETLVDLSERKAVLRSAGTATEFDADLVPGVVFDRFCRKAATTAQKRKRPASLPDECSLEDLLPYDSASTEARWASGGRQAGLGAAIGRTSDGVRKLDLMADGPHLLVAGTTGSGKSEFLRTLVAALSLSHSPDRLNLLFIDFKGGSGLGPFTGLPHCVGLLTDLNTSALDRALVSLRAETKRREELLSGVGAADLPSYHRLSSRQPALPHLVLVVDEFRMLVEEAPAALTELMRIATIGRSLGIHLVMATQRPQGALNADIRANVTTTVALRVQSDMESMDVMNSRAAAAIPVSCPGRAYLARGAEPPELFQTASLTLPAATLVRRPPLVRRTVDVIQPQHSLGPLSSDPRPSPEDAAAPIVETTRSLWARLGGPPPRRPVATPLPESVSPDSDGLESMPSRQHRSSRKPGKTTLLCLGLADAPEEQQVFKLLWQPSIDGHLGLVGPSLSGAPQACRAAVSGLAGAAEENHLYILDGDGSFAEVCPTGRVGAIAGMHEVRRGVRILERLSGEMDARRSDPRSPKAVPLFLAVSGFGAWLAAFRSGNVAWAEELLGDLVRDGSQLGVTIIISGDRELATSRLFAALPNRAFFPAGSTEEGRLAWPRFSTAGNVPGRAMASGAFLGGAAAESQFVLLPESSAWPSGPVLPAIKPFRVEPLPGKLSVQDVHRFRHGPATSPQQPSKTAAGRRIVVGVGGDELAAVNIALPARGIFLILGGPGSGKSNLLRVLPALNPELTWEMHGTPDRTPAVVHAGPPSILLVDDADTLTIEACTRLMELNAQGYAVVAATSYSPALVHRNPLFAHAQGHGCGLLLGPSSPSDGDLFGVRIDVDPMPVPGRAVLVQNRRQLPLQIPLDDEATAPAMILPNVRRRQ